MSSHDAKTDDEQETVGTEEELLTTMKLVIAVARITRRDILLPIRGVYIEKTSRMERLLHRRAIWSLFPLREIEEKFQVTILEPNYLEHASLYAGGDSASTRLSLDAIACAERGPFFG